MSQAWYWGSQEAPQGDSNSRTDIRNAISNEKDSYKLVGAVSSGALENVLGRLMRIIKEELALSLSTQVDYFQPSKHTPGENYYPKEVEREHQSYFLADKEKEALDQQKKEKSRVQQNVNFAKDDLIKYVFDRSKPVYRDMRKKTKSKLDHKASVFKNTSQRQWLSILCTSEEEIARVNFAAKAERYAKKFSKQSKPDLDWVKHNNTVSVHRRKMLEHLLQIIEHEQQKNIQLELKLCNDDISEQQLLAVKHKMAKSRAKTADWIMRILQDYGLISGTQMFDYLNDMKLKSPKNLSSSTYSTQSSSKSKNPRSRKSKDAYPDSSFHTISSVRQREDQFSLAHGHTELNKSQVDPDFSQEAVMSVLKRRECESRAAITESIPRRSLLGSSRVTQAQNIDQSRGSKTRNKRRSHSYRQQKSSFRDNGFISNRNALRPSTSFAGIGKRPTTSAVSGGKQYGGWGVKISYEAERISELPGVKSNKASEVLNDTLRVDKIDSRKNDYSFLLRRPITRGI